MIVLIMAFILLGIYSWYQYDPKEPKTIRWLVSAIIIGWIFGLIHLIKDSRK